MNAAPTLLDHLMRLFASPPSDVFVAPSIPEKKMNGARSFAAWGQETPLLLFDNTVFGSAKNGAVITQHALYVDTHKGRIDLSWIRSMPVYEEFDGTLQTPGGPVKLPKMNLTEAHDAFLRALETIVAHNTGLAMPAMAGPPVPGMIGQVAQHFLTGTKKLDMGGRASRRKLANAAAASSIWVDTLAGERIVAYGDETVLGKGDEYLLLTDRRLLARAHGEMKDVPYARITGVRLQKVTLAQRLVIDMMGGSASVDLVTLDDDAPAVAQFLNGVAALPYDQRWSPPAQLASPSDPSGAGALLADLPVPDPRIPILLRLAQAGVASGAMSVEAARDHVERARLFAANAAVGRGMSQGARLSPLHGEDLVAVLRETLGAPVGVTGDATTRVLDFQLTQGGSVGRAAASTAVGLAALAIVGVGWVSQPGRRTTVLRVRMRHLGSATGFSVFDLGSTQRDLAEEDPEMLEGLLESCAAAEPVLLLGRMLWGWQAQVGAILATPPQAFAEAVGRAIGWTDLAPFFAAAGR
ncbi:MAG: hypothetical protein R3B70_39495 [Polyangiaceae bacterium]